jgi:hypothetical protein
VTACYKRTTKGTSNDHEPTASNCAWNQHKRMKEANGELLLSLLLLSLPLQLPAIQVLA